MAMCTLFRWIRVVTAWYKRGGEPSFFGHNAEVRHLEVSRDGRLAASVADDNTLRVWTVDDGLPRQFIIDIPGAQVERMAFAPDGKLLGIINDNSAAIIDAESGEIVVRFELAERHGAIAFADPDHLIPGQPVRGVACNHTRCGRGMVCADPLAGRNADSTTGSLSAVPIPCARRRK